MCLAFLKGRGTLYLVGSSIDRRLSPLITALTEHVFYEAQRLASVMPDGRLSPALNMILDEVANTNPVPLDQWASDSRGWGITVIALVQSVAQFATTWGRDKGEVIWENLPTKIVLPGMTADRNLSFSPTLPGSGLSREPPPAKMSTMMGGTGVPTAGHPQRRLL
jgi:type IV secretion system protein VirD4